MFRNPQSFFSSLPPVVKNLLIINVMVWLLMAFLPAAQSFFNRYLALYYFTSPGFQPLQLFTYMFLHGGFGHMFFNMFALLMFGRTIEYTMGSARFLFYYISCGICAALVQMGVFAVYIHNLESILPPDIVNQAIHEGFNLIQRGYNYSDPDLSKLNAFVNSPMVGASGAIYGVLLAFGFLYPNVKIFLYFIAPIKAKYLIIGYFVLELLSGVANSADGVAHFAHLGGMISGFLLLWYWKRKGVFNNHWFF
ncbi:MAG: rhomboid family intramembrane serine protease [Muribaculaceae bacterium]|nr:rhomboid family intramembrane serine protease [Muribaculaceae bacterium]MDE6135620.1 rhomboid family intramembrane serine protease [Muribaculaceae bacterium]